ncbi:hypothetical protein [Sphingomonas gilva]|uniref:hypothetical protein n=1 Tax=Sphingomonas gilva TaxID=2305907 RepID=UPI0011C434F1|nr:hypothetical protein [Sphingomonas gilva]
MTVFLAYDPRDQVRTDLEFEDFIEVAQGGTIRSCATSDKFVEIGLSDEINIRFQAIDSGELVVILMSTLNEEDISPLRIRIVGEEGVPTAAHIEEQIRALRQSYAISYLINTGRAHELEQAINENPDADLEVELLDDIERLYISAASPGSLWLTIITKSAKAYEIAKYSLALPYKEGREALLKRVKADTKLKELAVEEKQLEIGLKRVSGLVDTLSSIDRLEDVESRTVLRRSLIGNLEGLGAAEMLALPRQKEADE